MKPKKREQEAWAVVNKDEKIIFVGIDWPKKEVLEEAWMYRHNDKYKGCYCKRITMRVK